MAQTKTRKIVIAAAMSAISIVLGLTHWGFIPWFSGASLTIMHVPVVIATVLEGPLVGVFVGLMFGVFSMLQAAIAPTGPADVWFTNPLLSVLPRLCIAPITWIVWRLLQRWQKVAILSAGVVGSLTNTILVLSMIGIIGYLPWAALVPIAALNGIPEAILSAIITLGVVAAWRQIPISNNGKANL